MNSYIIIIKYFEYVMFLNFSRRQSLESSRHQFTPPTRRVGRCELAKTIRDIPGLSQDSSVRARPADLRLPLNARQLRSNLTRSPCSAASE